LPQLKSAIHKSLSLFINSKFPVSISLNVRHYDFFLLILLCALSLVPCAAVDAATGTVTLGWNKNPEPENVTGYRMHYGITSGYYDHSVDVGNQTSCIISGIEKDRDYFYAVTAYNEVGESDFSNEFVHRIRSEPNTSIDPIVEPDPISDPLVEPDPTTDPLVRPNPADEPLDEVIIDNGDDGTFSTGIWKISRYPNPYGNGSLFSRNKGSRYSFEAAISGDYVVSLRWNAHRRSCRSVPVEIYDGNTLLETVEVNQKTDGGQWNELGGYLFNGTALVVVVSQGRCVTSVDGVEFVSMDILSPSIYRVTSTADSGGTIIPNDEVSVSAGSSVSYMIQPDANCHITDVKVDGTSVGPVTSYTFENVSADHTITVSFDVDAHNPAPRFRRSWRRHHFRKGFSSDTVR
jgi:hypothetical protein